MPETLQWTLESFKYYDDKRELFKEAHADLVRRTLQRYVVSGHRILEVGSGMGELVRLVPEYGNMIHQTDASDIIVAEHKKMNPNSNIVVSNVYDLKIPDKSFDVVVGYSMLDCLPDLEEALREIRRVLVSGGSLIHFLDLQASPNTIFAKYRGSEFVCYPYENERGVSSGIRLIPKDRIDELIDRVKRSVDGDRWYDFLHERYVQDPERNYFRFVSAGHNELLCPLADAATKYFPETKVVLFNEFFYNRLDEGLTGNGFEIKDFGEQEGSVTLERDKRHKNYDGDNIVLAHFGYIQNGVAAELETKLQPNKIAIVSEMHVAVARK